MSRRPSCVVPTLRDRKREETRRAIAGAAYAIVRDAGVAAVTADAVAERAGVSRRTFFNYFPSVESVLTASVTDFFAALSERLDQRPPTRTSSTASSPSSTTRATSPSSSGSASSPRPARRPRTPRA